ncbi:MAG: hypothetical protein JXR36_06805 [Bacteroidales bacterium]|nr:hypothetical protein [Bacteroidales bacterium]
MIKGKDIQQAFNGFGPDNFEMCEVGGVGVSGLPASIKPPPILFTNIYTSYLKLFKRT